MNVLYERCCGLDVHKKSVTACLVTPQGKEIRTFGTMTSDLLTLADWLTQAQCTHVAMESTGVYWKPIFNLLEGLGMTLLVVNAQHIKAVPGRKTDVKDAEWIADLLRHGLLRGSFVPDRDQRELRELVRYRQSLIRERAREVNRIQKVLEGANIKLASVASNVMGKSGHAMLTAMVQGVEDATALADLAKGSLKGKRENLTQAMEGLMGPHQRMLLATQLEHIEFLDRQIETLSREIAERMRPFEEALALADEIPGIGRRTAEQMLVEIGRNMDQFPTASHLASWAGMCPGNRESAGKRKSGATRKGNPWLRTTLVEAAVAASRTKNTYLSAQFHRLAARRGKKRAAMAVGHTMLVILYEMLKKRKSYQDLGVDYFDKRAEKEVVKRSVKRLEALGYKVSMERTAA
jgi:transposase